MLAAAVGEALNVTVDACRHINRGDLYDAFRVELSDGRRVFAKTERATDIGAAVAPRPGEPDRPAGRLTAEAAGLDWLDRANATLVPEVLAVNDDAPGFLILEWIEEGRGLPERDASFGRALARLHQASASGFGRDDGLVTGPWELPNERCRTWAEFYASQRLEPLTKLAVDTDSLPRKAIADIERVTKRIDILVGPREPPARLHGDLRAENRLVDVGGRSWLVAPKAFGGDRELDLAVMRLFGGFGESCFAAYDELFPLADGWQGRLPLYQLTPLIGHAIKSGGHYVGRLEQALLQLR